MTTPLTSDQQSAFDIISAQLTQWGIGSLAGDAQALIVQGLDANAVTIQLANTAAYQQRFAGNTARQQNGFASLTPAEYVATETAYKQVLYSYGLPEGFYDAQSDFDHFIATDISPQELATRAQIAQQVWLGSDAEAKDTWKNFYGLTDGAAIASILDPDTALPIVQRMQHAAQWGGEATRLGLDANQQRLEQYSDLGYTDATVDKGLQQTAVEQSTMSNLAQRFGGQYDQATAEKANIMNDGAAAATRQRLINNESSLFAGRTGADSAALTRSSGGQF